MKTVSGKVFIGLTNRAKMIGGGRLLLPEILDQSDRVGVKSLISLQCYSLGSVTIDCFSLALFSFMVTA